MTRNFLLLCMLSAPGAHDCYLPNMRLRCGVTTKTSPFSKSPSFSPLGRPGGIPHFKNIGIAQFTNQVHRMVIWMCYHDRRSYKERMKPQRPSCCYVVANSHSYPFTHTLHRKAAKWVLDGSSHHIC